MCPLCRLVVLAFWLLVRAAELLAQSPVDPSGHWEGAVQLPNSPLAIEVDVARNAKGELAATFAEPSAGVKGFPFSIVELQGRTLRLVLKAGEKPSTFTGTLSIDGKTISGNAEQGGEKTTFTLTRVGEARVAAQPKNARIAKELEGAWYGAIDMGGRQMRLVLKLANHADGTAEGTVMSPDGSGIEIPLGIKEKDGHVEIGVPSVGAAFIGKFDAVKLELNGQWTQSTATFPLKFRRSPF
jgi:hypothetical protein